MEEADELCEQLFLCLEKQEQCTEKLLAAAQVLENRHRRSNTVQLFGNVAALCGVVAIAATGGLAVPLAIALTSTVFSFTPGPVESGMSRLTFDKAKKCVKEVREIGDTIQTLLNKLGAKCASQALGASAASSDDESDECEVTTQIMGALARKFGIDVPLDLLRRFNKTTVFNQQRLVRSDHDVNMGMKTAIKRTALAPGGFVRLALSACDVVRNIKEIKNKRTEASRSLRTAAGEMEEKRRTLRKMIDGQREIIKNIQISEFRMLLKDLGGYSLTVTEVGEEVLEHITKACHGNAPIKSWVDENQAHFLNLFRFLRDHLLKHLEEEIEKRKERPLHIVFVAHGSIVDEFMPASVLVPTPSITDTILYPPWNCVIMARAAYGIAEGCIEPRHRIFYKGKSKTKLNHDHVPKRWNSMRESTDKVPQILLRPVTPKEPVWEIFEKLGGSVYRDDRIIIPYLQEDPEAPLIPFYMLVFGASYVLKITQVEATVHLAACSVRGTTRLMREKWAAQYAYTEDGTRMTVNIKDMKKDPVLLQALSMMFDNQQ